MKKNPEKAMTKEEVLHEKLHDIMAKELDNYIASLLKQYESPLAILERSYQYWKYRDIIEAIDEMSLAEEELEVLIERKNPLAAIYDYYLDCDTDEMDVIKDCICGEIDAILRNKKEKALDFYIGYIYDEDGKYDKKYMFKADIDTLARFLNSDITKDKVVTDIGDQLVVRTFGNFLDQVPDKDLHRQLLPVMCEYQMGEKEITPIEFVETEPGYFTQKELAEALAT